MSKFLFLLIVVFLLSSCGTPKQITELNTEAYKLAAESNTQGALQKTEDIIAFYESKHKVASDSTYAFAGELALKSGNNDKALTYLNKAIENGNSRPETYYNITQAYKRSNNLSFEISSLEKFLEKFPDSELKISAQKELMTAYIESENWTKAEILWKNIDDTQKSDTGLLEDYVILQNNLENSEEAYNYAIKLFAADQKNSTALFTLGSHYYNKAENLYNTEMAAYEKHKTRRQYAYLVDQLKIATKDYQAAKKYFEKLYKLNPQKEYAGYLANINARLNNKKQADYYRNLAK
ncbi:tetratricopeptide repeat protein [Saccharicrinis sp. FJH62]|uniref:tetratricopeptide repeat protein n=1 Tax=Saccharicrinis sp. FJH62 TaxID=3344657 RepID=UPI0035D40BB3